jgi:hypothetical protein
MLLVHSVEDQYPQGRLLLLRRERPVPEMALVLGEISMTQGQLFLLNAASELRVNGLAVDEGHRLTLGDRVGSIVTAQTLELIRVHDGD